MTSLSHRARLATLLLLLAVPPLAAQTTTAVIPPAYASVEGNSLDQKPFGNDRGKITQYVDASLLQAVPRGALLKAISYRRDTQFGRPYMMRSGMPPYYLRLASTSTSAFSPSPVWPGRPDQGPPVAGWTLVITARPVSLPTLTLPSQGPAPFEVRLPFDQPFSFDGPNLGIDNYVYDSVNSSQYYYFMDAVEQLASGGVVTPIGGSSPGCPTGENRATGIAPDPGGLLEMMLFAQPGASAWAMIGATPQNLDLGVLGMTGCQLYLQPAAFLHTVADSQGIARYQLAVPQQASLAGASVLGQWLVSDFRIAPLPFATSDGLSFTIGSDLQGQQVAMSVVYNTDPTAPSGFVTTGRGLVFQLEW